VGTVNTWYDSAMYQYIGILLESLSAGSSRPLVTADGRGFYHTALSDGSGNSVTAVLSSYSYRDTPFYSRMTPANAASCPAADLAVAAPAPWAYSSDYPNLSDPGTGWLAQWTLSSTRPVATVQFMCPPFKTLRALGSRAIACDAFDYAPAGGGAFTAGVGTLAHKLGYNVLYGDGHALWYADDDKRICNWTVWADPNPNDAGSDNLTISSASSQLVWNQFDMSMGIDCP
jgi:prepilin-type processing-associated H-X9-DG protein